MNKEILKEAGLNNNEIEVYLALTKYGSIAVSKISQITNLHRSNLYDTLEKLPPTCEQEDLLISKMEESELKTFVIEKGMVSYTNFTDICDTEPIYSNSTGDQFTCFYFCGV